MLVNVGYMAQIKVAAGTGEEQIELPESASVADLVQAITDRHKGLKNLLLDEQGLLRPTILVFINDAQADDGMRTTLKDSDDVSFLSPIAGG
ncbi:MAG: MoaD/ThiS family protein [Gemmataceae bacterium]